MCRIEDIASVPGRTHETLLEAYDGIPRRGKPTIRERNAPPIGSVLLCVARSTCLGINLCRVASVYPPMTAVVVFKHVLGMELCRWIRAKGYGPQTVSCSVLVHKFEREQAQLLYLGSTQPLLTH